MMRWVAVLLVVVLLPVVATAYYRVGWWRMESACSLSDATGSVHDSVSYAWTWSPPGFTCTYDDGSTETSLWP
ncbi:hypothetical protein GCM10023340_45240 [Nocardioides marinquilinus]|uniref:Secreted protein n=1 Tax=Nocardioides marinquilinus TaxID=1210400 RepID=A0ABP9Q4I3_9ACTN